MRVTYTTLTLNYLRNLQSIISRLTELQGRLASGKRVQKPSDDPVAVGQLVRLGDAVRATVQYSRNVDGMDAWVSASEIFLRAGQQALQGAREVAVRGANATLSREDREAIAQEVESYLRGLLDAANGDYGGRFLFAGYQVRTRPFEAFFDADGLVEGVRFTGDEGEMTAFRAAGSTFEYNVGGREAFAPRTHTIIGGDTLGPFTPGTFYVNDIEVRAESGLSLAGLAALIKHVAGEVVGASLDAEGRLVIWSRECAGCVTLRSGTSDILRAAGMLDADDNLIADQRTPLNPFEALIRLKQALTQADSVPGQASVTLHGTGANDAILEVRNRAALGGFALLIQFDAGGSVVPGSACYFPIGAAAQLRPEQQAQLDAVNAGGPLNADSFSSFGLQLVLNASPSEPGWQMISVEGAAPRPDFRAISSPLACLSVPGAGITAASGEATRAGEYQIAVESIQYGDITVSGSGPIASAENGMSGPGWQNAGDLSLEVVGGHVLSLRFSPALLGGRALTSAEMEFVEWVNETQPALSADLLEPLGITLTLGAAADGTQVLSIAPTEATVSVVRRDELTGTEARSTGTLYANCSAPTATPPVPGVTVFTRDLRPGTAVIVARPLLGELDAVTETLGTTIGRVGALSQGLQRTRSDLQQQKVTVQDLQSKLGDEEVTAAIVELSTLQTVYTAALAAGARLLPGSLLDYLR